jgi:hypothetical protein
VEAGLVKAQGELLVMAGSSGQLNYKATIFINFSRPVTWLTIPIPEHFSL